MSAQAFEEHRAHLRAVAYRMLGSLAEADDAVQETWLKYHGADVTEVRNLGGWLTTVISRVCLGMLRSRASRREQPMDETFVPDPVVRPLSEIDPEREVVHADSVGLALLVVLENLEPAERLAFVLHDMFAVPFDEIAPIVERSVDATRQLASRARRRVRGASPSAAPDLGRQRKVLDAFMAAARGGDFDALLAVLDPDVVLHADSGPLVRGAAASKVVRGARPVAEQAMLFRQFAPNARFLLLGDGIGMANVVDGQVVSLMGVTVTDGRITEMFILADPERLARLDLPSFAED